MHPISVRRPQFDYPDELDPVIVPGEPEESSVLVGLSLLLPYLEPYLIRTMKEAKAKISDPELLEEVKRFSAQEGQHFREHRRFNAAIRTDEFPKLAALEENLEREYREFSRSRSLRFNLAYAEGFEAMTTATALFLLEEYGSRQLAPEVERLMLWHAIEELEHRTVAFDVYDRLYGGYAYRLLVGWYAQGHLLWFAARVAHHMLSVDPGWVAAFGGRAGRRRRVLRLTGRVLERLAPRLLRSYLPWYRPHRIEFTSQMQEIADRFSSMAQRGR